MTEESDNLLVRNLSLVFNAFDANQDGTISGEDFDLMARRDVCEAFGIAVDSDSGRKICDAYRAAWDELRRQLDTDNDGQVTLEEFAAAEGGVAGLEELLSAQLGQATRLVGEAIDADGDGYISPDEFMRLLAPVLPDKHAGMAGFQQLDIDGDGRISMDEFQTGIMQMMFSNDPSEAGTSLLGQR